MLPHTPIFPFSQTKKGGEKKNPYLECIKKLLLEEKQEGF
jgi:hypothetical protein